jgi:hypothetical protein
VAQPGRAPGSGPGGRRFKSSLPDHLFQELTTILGFAERQRVYNKDSRLPDGSRVAAVLPPCSIDGITLTIRKFNTRHFTMADLIENGTLSAKTAELLGEMDQPSKHPHQRRYWQWEDYASEYPC